MKENTQQQQPIDEKALLEKIQMLELKELDMQNIIKSNAIKTSILTSGKIPYDTDMVLGLINYDEIEVDMQKGVITKGFKEQYENIVQNKSFLFNTNKASEENKMENNGIKFKGGEPLVGNEKTFEVDEHINYGKELAKTNLV